MKNILVTGATGFLGGHLINRLKQLNYNVYSLGRNTIVGKRLESQGISFINVSFEERGKIMEACKGMDYIFHCGALSSHFGKYIDYYNSNVVGTKNVIEGCEKYGVQRLIHVSTPSIYFCFNEGLNIKENNPLPNKLVNDYALTKWEAEKEIDKAFHRGLPTITIRPRAIFGEKDNALMPQLIKVNSKKGIPMFNGGESIIDITYVENVVDALILCMNTDKNNLGEKYNITNGEPMKLITILNKVFNELDVKFNKINMPYNMMFTIAQLMEWTHKHLLNYKEPILTKYAVSVLAKSQTLNIEDKKVVNTPVISEIYSYGYDIFGDESIIAINLPGHTKGHFGIFLKSKEKHFFFIADACWQRETYEDLIFPSRIAKIILT